MFALTFCSISYTKALSSRSISVTLLPASKLSMCIQSTNPSAFFASSGMFVSVSVIRHPVPPLTEALYFCDESTSSFLLISVDVMLTKSPRDAIYSSSGRLSVEVKNSTGFTSAQIIAVGAKTRDLFYALAQPDNDQYVSMLSLRQKEIFETAMKAINPNWQIQNTQSREEVSEQKKLNFVQEKLAAAGIEVVQDKTEFDRILNSAEILQKMQEENKVEDLFVSVNDSNLETEIDKLTINDVNVYNKFINISKDTPFILKEFGLNNYPVNIYKQKLARALFLEKEKFGERLTHGHKGEFTEKEVKEVFKNISNPRYIFNSKKDETIPENFYLIGVYDVFDKVGNPMMLSFHFDKNRKEIEANWITAVYGKNLNVLVNDWVKKGFLLYKNDLEIENASEEAVALYMRVSNLQKHLGDIIKQKSDYVNENNVFFYKKNNQTYGFAYEGKIYLNPEIASSEAAIHEYTHLWDNYTQRTNTELWEKGKNIFKKTSLWDEVKSDPNYADIADNDDLLLGEVHARICGKMAEVVLNRILEKDGELTKDTVIDWDKETWDYIYDSLHISVAHKLDKDGTLSFTDLKDFISTPMKDLMNGLQITKDVAVEPEHGLMTGFADMQMTKK